MSFSRTLVSSFARAAPRPQITRVTVNSQFASFRARVAAMSTISDVIIKDHRELESYYNEIINSDDVDHKTRFGNQFTWELARHSVAEELLIYPAMEKYIGGKEGHEHAEKDRQQHHQVKELLKEFQNMKATDSGYVPKLKELWAILGQHIKEEEKDDLPALESALAKAEKGTSESLAKNFGRTKMFVPSRSHPSAGENPLFEGPMGMLAAPLDHIADIFRKFPNNTISPNPSKK